MNPEAEPRLLGVKPCFMKQQIWPRRYQIIEIEKQMPGYECLCHFPRYQYLGNWNVRFDVGLFIGLVIPEISEFRSKLTSRADLATRRLFEIACPMNWADDHHNVRKSTIKHCAHASVFSLPRAATWPRPARRRPTCPGSIHFCSPHTQSGPMVER